MAVLGWLKNLKAHIIELLLSLFIQMCHHVCNTTHLRQGSSRIQFLSTSTNKEVREDTRAHVTPCMGHAAIWKITHMFWVITFVHNIDLGFSVALVFCTYWETKIVLQNVYTIGEVRK